MKRGRRWIQDVLSRNKGALHRDLGVPADETIAPDLLVEAIEHPERFKSHPADQRRLRKRAQALLNAMGRRKQYRRQKRRVSRWYAARNEDVRR